MDPSLDTSPCPSLIASPSWGVGTGQWPHLHRGPGLGWLTPPLGGLHWLGLALARPSPRPKPGLAALCPVPRGGLWPACCVWGLGVPGEQGPGHRVTCSPCVLDVLYGAARESARPLLNTLYTQAHPRMGHLGPCFLDGSAAGLGAGLLHLPHSALTRPAVAFQPVPMLFSTRSPPSFFHSPHCRTAWDSPPSPDPYVPRSLCPQAPQAPPGSPASGRHSPRPCTKPLGFRCPALVHLHGPAEPSIG